MYMEYYSEEHARVDMAVVSDLGVGDGAGGGGGVGGRLGLGQWLTVP